MKKELYERLTAWMADYEDSSILEETMSDKDIDTFLLDSAFDIMYDIYMAKVEEDEAEFGMFDDPYHQDEA